MFIYTFESDELLHLMTLHLLQSFVNVDIRDTYIDENQEIVGS